MQDVRGRSVKTMLAVAALGFGVVQSRPALAEHFSYLVTLDSSVAQGQNTELSFWIGVYNDGQGSTPGTYPWPYPYDDTMVISDLRTDATLLWPGTRFQEVTGSLPDRMVFTSGQYAVAGYHVQAAPLGTTMSFLLTFSGTQFEGVRPVPWTGFYMISNIPAFDNGSGFGTDVDIYREDGTVVIEASSAYTITPVSALLQDFTSTNWTAGAGTFASAANWSGGVPHSAINAMIPNTGPGTDIVDLDRSAFAKVLGLSPGSVLNLNGYDLQLSGNRLANQGTLNVDGTMRFIGDGWIQRTGLTHVTGLLTANETLTNGQGQTMLVEGPGAALTARRYVNNGDLIFRDTTESNLKSATSITNVGTLTCDNAFLNFRAPLLVNDGVIRTERFGVLRPNPVAGDFAEPMNITGSGRWEIGAAGMSIDNPVVLATTGEIAIAGGILGIGSAAQGTTLSMSNLAGTGTLTSGATVPVTILDGDAARSFDGVISGGFSLIKTGSGTQILNGDLSYSGTTAINGGTLLLNGVHSGPGPITVGNGGTLGGEGLLHPSVTIANGATLAPGSAGPGELEVKTILDLAAGSMLELELADGPASDMVRMLDNGLFDATSVGLRLVDAGATVGTTYWFLDWGNCTQSRNPITVEQFSIVSSELEGAVVVDHPNRRVGFAVTGVLAPADIDRDGDVDLADVALLVSCATGPLPSGPPAGCLPATFERSDLDDDGDVDLSDCRAFQEAFPGN